MSATLLFFAFAACPAHSHFRSADDSAEIPAYSADFSATDTAGQDSGADDTALEDTAVEDDLADFTAASQAQLRSAALVGTTMTYQIVVAMTLGSLDEALRDGSCPAISVAGAKLTLTGGCTSDSGVAFTGTASIENLLLDSERQAALAEYPIGSELLAFDPESETVWTMDSFGVTPRKGGGERLIDGHYSYWAGKEGSIALRYGRAPFVAGSTLLVECDGAESCADVGWSGSVSGLGSFAAEPSADYRYMDLIGVTTLRLTYMDADCVALPDGMKVCLADELFPVDSDEDDSEGGGDKE